MHTDYLLVLNTCPDQNSAEQLAVYLVEQQLAACVTLLPKATSIYRWKDAVQTATEIVLLIKTRIQCYAALEAALVAHHPYQVPELIAFPIAQGLAAYLHWISINTPIEV